MFNMIPLPAAIDPLPGEFHLTAGTMICHDDANCLHAGYLRGLLSAPTGFPFGTGEQGARNTITLRIDPSLAVLGPEGYRLAVQPEAVDIAAPAEAGVFYGIQTLRQMLPFEIETRTPVPGMAWTIPCALIHDRPRFSWRGFMLDEGRHFHGKETVRLVIDLMALQKLNILHWHLTEDQGWRIEIQKYPRLTTVGSQRAGTSMFMLGKQHNGIPHGGFYTQEDIREIVAYAAGRHITIVPEIEMPGHSLAALAAYPEFSCTGGPFEVATRFGIHSDIYCAGKEGTFAFLQDVLDEVISLFPSKYIHVGGDEAPKARWKKCPDCQRRMLENGLKDGHALQIWFTNRIAAYLDSKGRHMVGWNDILQDGLAEAAVVQFWVGNRKRLVEAIREGRPAVMTDYLDTYLDHSYSLMPLRRAYRYEPVPRELDEQEAASILGLEFPLWTEWVPDRPRLDYQAHPRLSALAETGWTPKARKDYADFRRRLGPFLQRLDRFGVRYAPPSGWDPSAYKRLFSIFTIPTPQTKVSQ